MLPRIKRKSLSLRILEALDKTQEPLSVAELKTATNQGSFAVLWCLGDLEGTSLVAKHELKGRRGVVYRLTPAGRSKLHPAP